MYFQQIDFEGEAFSATLFLLCL